MQGAAKGCDDSAAADCSKGRKKEYEMGEAIPGAEVRGFENCRVGGARELCATRSTVLARVTGLSDPRKPGWISVRCLKAPMYKESVQGSVGPMDCLGSLFGLGPAESGGVGKRLLGIQRGNRTASTCLRAMNTRSAS
jgi:hypothetical protein